MKDPGRRILAGHLGTQLFVFGSPLALGMGLQTTFNLVDAYMVSKLERDVAGPALGAIGVCDQLAALGTIVSYGLSVGTAAIMSRKQGAGDGAGVRHVAWQSLLAVLLLSLVVSLLGLLGSDWLVAGLIGAKGDVATLGASYLAVLLGGSATIFLLLHLTTILRALGSSVTPVSLLLTANALNFVFAVLLVYGPGPAPALVAWGPPIARLLGIPRLELLGAAWATVLARAFVLLPLFLVSYRRFGLFQRAARKGPDRKTLLGLFDVSWPSSAQLVVRIVVMLLVHSLVARAYTTATDQSATTALGIVFRLETMALFISLGWGSAAQTFVGQNLGAGNRTRARESGWLAAGYNATMMAALALIYVAHGEWLIAFFDESEGVIAVGLAYLHAVGPSYVALGFGMVLGTAMQGAGATRLTLKLDLGVLGLFQVPACLAAVVLSPDSHSALFGIVALTYFAFAAVYVASYQRGRFLSTVLRHV